MVPIALFGEFEGGALRVESETIAVRGGDVVLLRAALWPGSYMPFHEVRQAAGDRRSGGLT